MNRNFYKEEKFLIELFQDKSLTIHDIVDSTLLNRQQVVALLRKHRDLFLRRKDHSVILYQIKPNVYLEYQEHPTTYFYKGIKKDYKNELLVKLFEHSSSKSKYLLQDKLEYLQYCFLFHEILYIYYSLDIINKEEYLYLTNDYTFSKKQIQALFLKVTYFFQNELQDQKELFYNNQKELEKYFDVLEVSLLFNTLNITSDMSYYPVDIKDTLKKYIQFLYTINTPVQENKPNNLTLKWKV